MKKNKIDASHPIQIDMSRAIHIIECDVVHFNVMQIFEKRHTHGNSTHRKLQSKWSRLTKIAMLKYFTCFRIISKTFPVFLFC